MSCETLQARLQEFLEGKLAPRDRQEADAHLETCAQCSELIALMRLDPQGLTVEPPPDLVGVVLERTSGSACERARDLLCERTDAALEPLDDELLRGHLGDCGECTALATALARLPEDLAAMAEIAPDDRFVADVLAVTSARPSRWAGLAARLATGWAAMIARPRFAWEAAYVGAVALWIIGGAFGAPLRAASEKLDPNAPVEVVRTVGRKVSVFGQQAWSVTGVRGKQTIDEFKGDLTERLSRTEPVLVDLRQHGTELGTAALELDMKQGGEALQKIKGDARTFWQSLATTEDESDENQAD